MSLVAVSLVAFFLECTTPQLRLDALPAGNNQFLHLERATQSYSWQAAWLLFAGACIAAAFAAVYVTVDCWRSTWAEGCKRHAKVATLALVAIGAVGAILIWNTSAKNGLGHRVLQDFPTFVGSHDLTLLGQPQYKVMRMTRNLGEAIAVLVAMGTVATLLLSRDLTTRVLAERLERLRTMLFASAVLFVSGMLVLDAECKWILTFLPLPRGDDGKALFEHVRNLIDSRTYRAGAVFTLLIAVVYIPCIAILSHYADSLARKANEGANEEAIRTWKKEQGIDLSSRALLAQLGAMFSPALSAPILKVESSPFLVGNLHGSLSSDHAALC